MIIKGKCLYSKELVYFNLMEVDIAHSKADGVTYIAKSENNKLLQRVDFSDAAQIYTDTIEFLKTI